MRALTKTARKRGAMAVEKRETPSIGPEEVRVAVDWVGMCGSDAGIYAFKSAFERMTLPTIIGHEYAGTVEAVGEHVEAFRVGDRVVERPIRGCGTCFQCRRGIENVCQSASITGVDHDGAFAGSIAVPARFLTPIPDNLSNRQAALAEPTSVAVRAVCRNSRVRPGDSVLVEGPGPIGLLSAQIARAQGGKVTVSGVEQDAAVRLALAEDLGFRTINVDRQGSEELLDPASLAEGFDVVIDATGHPNGLTTGVEVVRSGGQIVLVGQTGETTMPYSPLVRGEIDLQCSYASTTEDFERAFTMLGDGTVATESMVDTTVDPEDPTAAFEAFLEGQTVKPLFDVSGFRA